MLICAELAPYIETRFGVKPQEQNRESRWAQSGQYLNGLGRAVTIATYLKIQDAIEDWLGGKSTLVMMTTNNSKFRNWAKLEKDFISQIFVHLSVKDAIRCGSVCHSWREAASSLILEEYLEQ
ncbi:hypothetical protein ACLB2K_026733 [Fragaria x ananassa]